MEMMLDNERKETAVKVSNRAFTASWKPCPVSSEDQMHTERLCLIAVDSVCILVGFDLVLSVQKSSTGLSASVLREV